jgi:DNA-binding CsgD family transcriptional regulator
MSTESCPVGAVLVVDRRGTVVFAAAQAQILVADYIGPLTDNRLPAALVDWLTGPLDDAWAPFVVERDSRRLVLRMLVTTDAEEIVVAMEEQHGPRNAELSRRGLTRRESEILWWVTEGKTNREIAIILGRSARTVQIHLNNVYRKLGVETRTAAAMLALRASLVRDTASVA